ncbi:hypothetical protein REH65_32190 [Saccharopolyspora sp. ID03-671]|uniref:hypothetical protein n=1 Tax=Saccharopolyspora sp. ID03-671 TaxID=3073066 RepID=UPI003256282A
MSERLQVLSVVYQAERTDRATTLTVSLATIGAAVTYLVGTIAFYDKLDLLGWAISLLPLPMICVAAFQSQLLNLAAVRARSIRSLEDALLTQADGLDDLDREHIGVAASERTANVHTAALANKLTLIIAYGGVALAYLTFIVLMLVRATRHISGWVAIPAVTYALLLAPIGFAVRHAVRNLRAATQIIDPGLETKAQDQTGAGSVSTLN